MEIRKTCPADVPRVLEIYDAARAYMRREGNFVQWTGRYPLEEDIFADIALGRGFVGVAEGRIVCTFALVLGEDPTYAVIEGGAWLNDAPYGTIHRLAASGEVHGCFASCLNYCRAVTPNLRADTHESNRTMRHLLEKHGFRYCGIIYVADGTPRMAYQWTRA